MRRNNSKIVRILFLGLLISVISCNNQSYHLIKDTSYRNMINSDFNALSSIMSDSLFKEINKGLTGLSLQEAEAYKFLYAYMPISDIYDYTPKFYVDIIKATFEARDNLKRRNTIPEDVFRHFVLPCRVNNENLDTSRQFFYNQLKDRIKNMDMLEAALEVDHWCHEHVSYRSSDERTLSPLATYFNGYGRCGEESVFTVAALRAVGIPARQVYTPRWAHTDDNHAWVEFWANGKWYYYGACEPVPEPNMGWFTEPARRAMLVNTKVMGRYKGGERILIRKNKYSILNTLNVYAQTKEIFVKVSDENKKLLPGAWVDFQLYNYAEYYSLAHKLTNKRGIASFKTGLGSLLVWAYKNDKFAWKNINVLDEDTLRLILKKPDFRTQIINFDYHPPIKPSPREVSKEGERANKIRLAYEDSLRAAYEKTFIDSVACAKLAADNGLEFEPVWKAIKKSRGNWSEIAEFIKKADKSKKQMAVDMLNVIADKDLKDTKADVLLNHLSNCPEFKESGIRDKETYDKYLLNPRIRNELITSYRSFLQDKFNSISMPEDLFNWVKENIKKADSLNFYRVPISPKGVYQNRIADSRSRDIFLIALFRSKGIPARFESGTFLPQYFWNDRWITLHFDKKKHESRASTGWLHFEKENKQDKLLYYKHFTIAKYESGQYHTLEYDWLKPLEDFPDKIKLECGHYRLSTGNRMPDGSVLVSFKFFDLKKDKTTNLKVSLRKQRIPLKVLGRFTQAVPLTNADNREVDIARYWKEFKVLIWINPLDEPSKHVVQSISRLKKTFEDSKIPVAFISRERLDKSKLDEDYFGNIPGTVEFFTDPGFQLHKQVYKVIKQKAGSNLPLLLILNKKNEIIYKSEGYKIGAGEEIIKVIAQ